MSRRGLMIGGALLGLLVIVFGLITLSHGPLSTYTPTNAFIAPSSFQTATPYGEDAFIYTNGRSFATYSYASGLTALLTGDTTGNGLRGVSSITVSADKNYLVFHSESAPTGSDLATALQRDSLPNNRDYWWIYDIQAKRYTALNPGGYIVQAKISGNQLFALKTATAGETIVTYNLASPQKPVAEHTIPRSADYFPAIDNGYILETSDNQVLYTADGVVSKKYFDDMRVIGISNDHHTAIAVEGKQSTQKLIWFDIAQHNTTHIISDVVTGNPVFNPSTGGGMVLFTVPSDNGTQQLKSYDITSHSVTDWKLQKSAAKLAQQNFTINDIFDAHTALLTDTANNLYLVGSGLANLKLPDTSYARTITYGNGSAGIGYDGNSLVVKYSASADQPLVQAVYKQLRNDGYNPDLITINYTHL